MNYTRSSFKHKHTWIEADCIEPKHCSKCSETEGEALGHTWSEANCSELRHCIICGAIEGEALGHTWVEASCSEPKHCTVCGATEGEALGHKIVEGTCTEPSTCMICGNAIGIAPGHTLTGDYCVKETICSTCQEVVPAQGHQYSEATCVTPSVCLVCGAIGSEPLGHTTKNGICNRCGEEIHVEINPDIELGTEYILGQGNYTVGEDIPAGRYKVTYVGGNTHGGYLCGSGQYLPDIADVDAGENYYCLLRDGDIFEIKLASLSFTKIPSIKNTYFMKEDGSYEFGSGFFFAGIDLPYGKYNIEAVSGNIFGITMEINDDLISLDIHEKYSNMTLANKYTVFEIMLGTAVFTPVESQQ